MAGWRVPTARVRACAGMIGAFVVALASPAAAQPAESTAPAAAPAVHAASPAAQRRMSQQMKRYFRGELDAAAMALGLGAGSGWAGGMLLSRATDGSRAASVPVLVVGAAELAIGIGLLLRTPSQIRELDGRIADDPRGYAQEEGARMAAVVDRFDLFMAAELVVLGAGAVTTTVGAVVREDRAIGAGVGVMAQASLVILFDTMADARAETYLEAIRAFGDLQLAPWIDTTRGSTSQGLRLGGTF